MVNAGSGARYMLGDLVTCHVILRMFMKGSEREGSMLLKLKLWLESGGYVCRDPVWDTLLAGATDAIQV